MLIYNHTEWNIYLTFQLVFIVYEYLFITFGYSINPSISLSTLKTFLFNTIISIAVIAGINTIEKIEMLLEGYTYISAFDLIFIIIYVGGTGAEGRLAHNMPRPFSDTGFTAIEVGMIAVWASLIAFYMFYKTKKKRYLLFQILYWVVILWSGSRDCCAFGFVSLSFLYFFINTQQSFFKKIKRILLILFALAFVAFLVLKVPALYDIIGYRFVGFLSGTEMSALSRQTMRTAATTAIQGAPIFGYGLAVFQTFPGSFGSWAHNNYLELMVSGGIVLLLIYYFPILVVAIKYLSIKDKTSLDYLGISLLLLRLLHEITGVTYLSRMSNFFLLIAIIILFKRTLINNQINTTNGDNP